MNRYTFVAKAPMHHAVAWWDEETLTLSGSVYEVSEGHERLVYSIGCKGTLIDFMRAMAPFATVPFKVRKALLVEMAGEQETTQEIAE